MAHRWALLVGVGWRFHGSGDCSGSQVRRDSSTGLISPMSLPSGPATIAHRASQKASNGGCRPARHNGEFGLTLPRARTRNQPLTLTTLRFPPDGFPIVPAAPDAYTNLSAISGGF